MKDIKHKKLYHMEMNSDFEMDNITKTFNDTFQQNVENSILKVAISKFKKISNIFEKVKRIKENMKTHNELVSVPVKKCITCNLELINFESNKTLTYCYDGCHQKEFLVAKCTVCKINYKTDCYETMDKKKYLYNDKIVKYVLTSSQTAFEITLLNWLDINIVRNQISFSGFSDAYNRFFIQKDVRYLVNHFLY